MRVVEHLEVECEGGLEGWLMAGIYGFEALSRMAAWNYWWVG